MINSFLSNEELLQMGFAKIGSNCKISKYASFYNPGKIHIGNNVRIDDFCIFSGNIELKNYIHISAYCALYGSNGIKIEDFSGISARTTIYSAMDDFSGDFLINPTVPLKYTNVKGGNVVLHKYVQLGANNIVFPNLTIGEGTVSGAFTLINEDLLPWKIYLGIPAKILKDRSKKLIEFANEII